MTTLASNSDVATRAMRTDNASSTSMSASFLPNSWATSARASLGAGHSLGACQVMLGAAAARSGQNSMHNTSENQTRTAPIYERRAKPTTHI
jgi:hypothetical protein